MLMLSRKLGQSIRIADDIEVRVVRISGNRVRLGIEAPRHVSVVRTEVAHRRTSGDAAGRMATAASR